MVLNFVIVCLASCLFVTTESSVVYAKTQPSSYYNPYAFGYSYTNSPYIPPYPLAVQYKYIDQQYNHQTEEPAKASLGSVTSLEALKPFNEVNKDDLSYPTVYTVPHPITWATQFHQQDGLGQYRYGYANPHSAKHEIKSLDGTIRGIYSYVDSNDEIQTVHYVSDGLGFRVAATNLPKAVEPVDIPDSPEVQAAKEEHFKAHREAIARLEEANKNEGCNETN